MTQPCEVEPGAPLRDHPSCTHRAMAELARQVDDRVSTRARPLLASRVPALASVGPGHPGVSAAVAAAVVLTQRQYAPNSLLLPWRSRQQNRLRRTDVPGQRWWGRTRDLLVTYDLIHGGLDRLGRSTGDAAVRDRLLLGVVDRALMFCQEPATTLRRI